MDRRDAVIGTGMLAFAALAAARKVAAEESPHAHHGSHHKALADAAGTCVANGEACLHHCLDLMGDGHKELGGCAKSVTQMLSLCGALQNLANQDSKHLVKLASVALDACQDCEEECKKHAEQHEVCKRCGESCAACARECRQIAG